MDNTTMINTLRDNTKIQEVVLPKLSNAGDFWEELASYVYGSLPSLENRLDVVIRDTMREFQSTQSLDLLTREGKLLKRFGKYFKALNGFALDDRYLGVIGDKLQYYLTKDTRSFYVDFTNSIDWNDGQFGKGDSCWWGCYSESRETFTNGGGWAIRFYRSLERDNDNGIGRCWIVPKYNVLLCFNAYGIDRAKVSKVIKAIFDKQGIELHYSAAEVYNSHNSDIPYINGDSNSGSSGSFVLWADRDDLRERYNIDMKTVEDNKATCEGCGGRFDEENGHYTNDYFWCDSCHDERFAYCDCCQDYVDSDDVYSVRDGDYDYLCSHCASRRGYAMCEDCRQYSENYTIADDTSSTYCDHCAERNTEYCEHCQEYHEDIDYHNTHVHAICTECDDVLVDANELYDHNVENHPESIIELVYN